MSAREKKREGGQAAEFQVNEQELQGLSERVAKRRIEEKDWEILHRYLLLFLKLSQVLQYGRIRMKKIARMLFGKRTEKEKQKGKDPSDNPPESPVGGEKPSGSEQNSGMESAGENHDRGKRKGHGRRAASDYQNAETIICPMCHNKPGDLCPACGKGRLRLQPAEVTIRFTGNPPVTATKYEREKVRCDSCGQKETPYDRGGRPSGRKMGNALPDGRGSGRQKDIRLIRGKTSRASAAASDE
jgi:hypothetical protein